MITIRSEARRKGLRMAAHVAALSGVLAAAAAASQAGAAEVKGAGVPNEAGSSDGASAETAERMGDLFRVNAKSCGCVPCWGPPAPPAMDIELLTMFEEAEVAA